MPLKMRLNKGNSRKYYIVIKKNTDIVTIANMERPPRCIKG